MDPITEIHLEMFSKEYEVITYNVRFSQSYIPKTGKPDDRPIADTMYIEIVSDREDDFLEWMLEHNQNESGKIIFKVGNQIVKTVEFDGAVLVGYNQNPGGTGNGRQITEDLTISFQKIKFKSADYDRAA